MKRAHRPLLVLLSLGLLGGCTDPLDPGPTPVGPVAVSFGGERVEGDGTSRVDPGPMNVNNDAPARADPPSATLRAPADPRIEEVDSQTGLPPIPR